MPIYDHAYHGGPPPESPPPPPDPSGLLTAGPVVPVQIEIPTALAERLQAENSPIPAPVSGMALIDTGASVSAVDVTVVERLGVQPVGIRNVGTAGGQQQQNVYPIRITLPLHRINFDLQALGASISHQGIVALLGRDFLTHFLVVYNGPTGRLTLAV